MKNPIMNSRWLVAALTGLALSAQAQFVTFFDHLPGTIGTQTHANAVTTDIVNLADGSSLGLVNISDGTPVTGISVTINKTSGLTSGSTAGVPNAGTPAATASAAGGGGCCCCRRGCC